MTKRRTQIVLLVGVILITLGVCLNIGIFSGGIFYWIQTAPDLEIAYEAPSTVKVGDQFNLVIILKNTGQRDILVNQIDLDKSLENSLFQGTSIESTDPPMEIAYGAFWMEVFQYQHVIPAGESRQAIFHLSAIIPGDYISSIGVTVGNRSKRGELIKVKITE